MIEEDKQKLTERKKNRICCKYQEELQQRLEKVMEQWIKKDRKIKRVNPLQKKLFLGPNQWRIYKNIQKIFKGNIFILSMI